MKVNRPSIGNGDEDDDDDDDDGWMDGCLAACRSASQTSFRFVLAVRNG